MCTIPLVTLLKKYRASTHNHKPQLCPQHCNHHDEVHKNVILNTMGMMQSIAYCLNHLLNRETVMVIKMTCNVGTEKK